MGPQSVMGPHAYNFIFNPTDAIITTALAAHSTYSTSLTHQASALDSVKAVRDADSSMVLANVWFLRAYSTKAKTYTFDIATISGGKFKSGDVLELKYLLGSYDLSVYHSGNSAAVKTLETNAQSKIAQDTVDANGYVTFNIYGGGFLALTKIPAVTTGLKESSLNSSVNVYPCPFTNVLNVSVSGMEIKELKINDISGRTVLNKTSNVRSVDTSHLLPGLYLVQLTTNKGQVTRTVIKK